MRARVSEARGVRCVSRVRRVLSVLNDETYSNGVKGKPTVDGGDEDKDKELLRWGGTREPRATVSR